MKPVKPSPKPAAAVSALKQAKTVKTGKKVTESSAQARLQTKKTGGQGTSLTAKQEKFALGVATGMTQADAYRSAYDAKNMKPEVIANEASALMGNHEIAVRVESHRLTIGAKAAEEVSYEYQDAMNELDEVIAFATECKNPGARVAALNLKQKISGLHVEDRKNDRNPVAGMGPDRVKAALEALQAMRKAKEAALS